MQERRSREQVSVSWQAVRVVDAAGTAGRWTAGTLGPAAWCLGAAEPGGCARPVPAGLRLGRGGGSEREDERGQARDPEGVKGRSSGALATDAGRSSVWQTLEEVGPAQLLEGSLHDPGRIGPAHRRVLVLQRPRDLRRRRAPVASIEHEPSHLVQAVRTVPRRIVDDGLVPDRAHNPPPRAGARSLQGAGILHPSIVALGACGLAPPGPRAGAACAQPSSGRVSSASRTTRRRFGGSRARWPSTASTPPSAAWTSASVGSPGP